MRWHASNFLKYKISKGIEEYKFKIINYKDQGSNFTDIGIGVVFLEYFERNQSDNRWMINYPFAGRDTGCCYHTMHGLETPRDGTEFVFYGVKCKEDDIVSMIVDLENYQIRYKVNDQELGVAFKDIKQTSYKVAVYLYGICKVKIIK